MSWKVFFQSRKNITEFIVTVVVLIILMMLFSRFLLFIEQRQGVVLTDPLLNSFNPINLTWIIFTLIYLSIIIFLIDGVTNPPLLMSALQAYGLMVLFRAMAMYLTPFEPPAALLPLTDPFVQIFGGGNILEKDLFFSGHTATLFLLFLLTERRVLKLIFLIFSLLVGLFVILQHVHYSIDVFAAPFFAYASYRIILLFKEKANGKR